MKRSEDGQHYAQMCYLDLTPHSAEVTTRIVMFVGLGIQIKNLHECHDFILRVGSRSKFSNSWNVF